MQYISADLGVTLDDSLTPRQTQVLKLICHRGLGNKAVGNILKISESTVKIHVSAILKHYGVKNRTQLVLAYNNNLRA
jgi:DNA-binding NarL/FixJ family response regulator